MAAAWTCSFLQFIRVTMIRFNFVTVFKIH